MARTPKLKPGAKPIDGSKTEHKQEPKPGTQEQSENKARTRGLRPFPKGVSGNPGGRPKGTVSITKHLRAALEAQDEKKAIMLAEAIILQAAKGNGVALKQVLDRIDGPVVEESNTNGSLTIRVVRSSDNVAGAASRAVDSEGEQESV